MIKLVDEIVDYHSKVDKTFIDFAILHQAMQSMGSAVYIFHALHCLMKNSKVYLKRCTKFCQRYCGSPLSHQHAVNLLSKRVTKNFSSQGVNAYGPYGCML